MIAPLPQQGIRSSWTVLMVLALAGVPGGCVGNDGARVRPHPRARRVLMVANAADPQSLRLAHYYRSRRGIPASNIVTVAVDPVEEIRMSDYEDRIEAPVRAALRSMPDRIDYIVTLRGVPLRTAEGGLSVDALLGAMDLDLPPVMRRDPVQMRRLRNPYWRSRRPFRSTDWGFYLVCRLDGYTIEDAMALVDRAISADAKRGVRSAKRGSILLDVDPSRDASGYRAFNDSMRRAAEILEGKGIPVTLDEAPRFAGSGEALAGYASWGSNDGRFQPETYRSLRFVPGAIGETAVSTGGRTFRPAEGGQSLVADLIADGITGVMGHVSEPLTMGLGAVDVLFDRYTAGFNLAESYGMATPLLEWKEVVIGDPLCAPYSR